MKTIIAITLAAIAMSASAEVRFESKTTAGGNIVLTLHACEEAPPLRRAYLTAPGGQYFSGCWGYFDDRVHVAWNDGSRYAYEPELFRKIGNDDAKPKAPKAKGGSL